MKLTQKQIDLIQNSKNGHLSDQGDMRTIKALEKKGAIEYAPFLGWGKVRWYKITETALNITAAHLLLLC